MGMKFQEESPQQYVDIARVPDTEMRPERSLRDRGQFLPQWAPIIEIGST
jgi:hypothetical protein